MPFSKKFDAKQARHSFIVGAWEAGASVVCAVSNYEAVDSGEFALEARSQMSVSRLSSEPGKETRVVIAGATEKSRAIDRAAIGAAAKANESGTRIKDLCAKAVKSVAYRQNRKGSVGTSVQWAIIGEGPGEAWFGLDVVGGTKLTEVPNLINIAATVSLPGGMQSVFGGPRTRIKSIYIEQPPPGRKRGRYEEALAGPRIDEPRCTSCGTPVPEGQSRCEGCDRTSA